MVRNCHAYQYAHIKCDYHGDTNYRVLVRSEEYKRKTCLLVRYAYQPIERTGTQKRYTLTLLQWLTGIH
jgi:hypothetical protein